MGRFGYIRRVCGTAILAVLVHFMAMAQTNTGLEDKLILTEERDFLLCNDEGKQFRTKVYNETNYAGFKDGTYELDLGNGTVMSNLFKTDFPKTITYSENKEYVLTFSVLTTDGVRVSQVYPVRALGRPKINLQKQDEKVQCLRNNIYYVVDVSSQNTSGTKYTLNYDDGTAPDVKTNAQLIANGGKFVHQYDHSYCDIIHTGSSNRSFVLKLTVENECGYVETTTLDEFVVQPLDAKFSFDKLKNCTYEKIKLRNLTTGGGNSTCGNETTYWEWSMANGWTSDVFEPEITFEEAGTYGLTLKASNGYSCAESTAAESVMLIDRVIADFEILRDTLCSGEILRFVNHSTGDELQPSRWTFVSELGFAAPTITNGNNNTTHPEVRFDDYGKYSVSLAVSNDCSSDVMDTVVFVKKDPHIHKLDVPVEMCPPRLDLSGRVAFDWNGNEVNPTWTITREGAVAGDGFTYGEGTDGHSEFPKLDFTIPGNYTVKVEVKSVGCGKTTLVMEKKINVHDPVIVKNVTSSVPVICEMGQVSFKSVSTGENLKHKWTVSPTANVEWVGGCKDTDTSPVLLFKQYGDYLVNVQLSTFCGSVDSTFLVHVKKEPNLFYFEPQAAVCPEDVIDFKSCMVYQFYNNPEEVTWTVTPATGLEFEEGTGLTSLYPKIRFKTPGTYTFTVKLKPVGCSMAGITQELTRKVKVRNSAMTLGVNAEDTTVCESNTLAYTMTAASAEDDPLIYNWTVTPLTPPGDYAFEDFGSQRAVARIRFKAWGTYTVRGEVSGYCGRMDSTMRVKVKKAPEVRLRDTVGICPDVIDMARLVDYVWYNSEQKVKWEIEPVSSVIPGNGFEYVNGTNETTLFPQVNFKRKGEYQVKATLNTVGCSEQFLIDTRRYTVYDTTIVVDVNPDSYEVCEGTKVRFRNMSDGVGVVYAWEITGQEGGYVFDEGTDAATKAPVIRFDHYGEYTVKVRIEGTCNRKEKTFKIVVRGVPEIRLAGRMNPVCAGAGTVDMKAYAEYTDLRNSDVVYAWTITPPTGYEYEPGYGADGQFPRIRFIRNGHYTLALHAYSGCPENGVQTLLTEIDVLTSSLQSAFAADSIVCVPGQIRMNNTSDGDSLAYKWSIMPETVSGGGWSWDGLDSDVTASPVLNVTEEGFYTVLLRTHNICGDSDSAFRIRAFAMPEVQGKDIAGICEPFVYRPIDHLGMADHNDRVNRAQWTIVPDADAGVPVYLEGTDGQSLQPKVRFPAGVYRVNAKYWNRCPVPGEVNFEVNIDKFIPIDPLRDTAVCVLTLPFDLVATPTGGRWSADTARTVLEAGGRYVFTPEFDPYFEGDVEVVYHFSNGSCRTTDTMNVHIYPLPHVEAGEPRGMCLNHEPQLLTATPAGGFWMSGGELLPEDFYTAVRAGDFGIVYTYTDGERCVNRDSTVMTVHPLPVTTFGVPELKCRYADIVFTPEQPDGNSFEWDFGDETGKLVSSGEIAHKYQIYGDVRVSNRTTTVYGCRSDSDTVDIEIVNIPEVARFDADTVSGCAPFRVNLRIDPEKYADDHNYLSFAWDYGDGVKTDTLMPVSPKYYPSGIWDTTYMTRFTVSNRCGSSSYDTLIRVYSVPVAQFELMHKWECSPVLLEIQNTTTGNGCNYVWTFTNGRTDEETKVVGVRNPVREFVTDDRMTPFYITLTASNVCLTNVKKDTLVVKPRTISAHFTSEKQFVCVGEEVCFRNNSTDTLGKIGRVEWNFGDGIKDTLWNICHTYAAAGEYTVGLEIDNGCGFDTISDRITVHALPQLTILGEDHLCEEDTFTFVLHSDQKLARQTWDMGDGNTIMSDSFRYVYDGYGKYTIRTVGVIAQLPGCSGQASRQIEVYNKPIVTILPLDTMDCSPLFYRPAITGDGFFTWDFDDGSLPNSIGEHEYVNLTDTVRHHTVRVHVETDKGCISDYRREVKVYNLPRARLDKEVIAGKPEKVIYKNLSEEATSYVWNYPGGEEVHSDGDQELAYDRNGIYEMQLIAFNVFGCSDTTRLEHEVLMKGLFFPNTFIPHSKNEQVNRFKGYGIGLKEYKLEIYDMYGNRLWETTLLEGGQPSEGWDGLNEKGELMPQGVYMWRARAVFGNADVWTGSNNDSGVKETVQGTVLLLRE